MKEGHGLHYMMLPCFVINNLWHLLKAGVEKRFREETEFLQDLILLFFRKY